MSRDVILYKVVIIDRVSETVIFDGNVIATDSNSALANVVVANAKDIAGKYVHTYVSSITSFTSEK